VLKYERILRNSIRLFYQQKSVVKSSGRSIKFLKWLLSYYAVRFSICGFFFAYIFLSNVNILRTIEGNILVVILQTLKIPAFYSDGSILVGTVYAPLKFSITAYTQIFFLMFFPTVAVTARTSTKIRIKLLSFGTLCFFLFVIIQFLVMFAMVVPGINSNIRISNLSFIQMSTFLSALVGGLLVDLTLFFTITLPKPTKIKSIVKRNYRKEYIYFLFQTATAIIFIYFMFKLQMYVDSPAGTVAVVHFNIASIIVWSYFTSYFFYSSRTPNWLKYVNNNNNKNGSNPNQEQGMTVSFLLPAYNEEKFIQRVVESIDRAASKYQPGKCEIVLVNDGSTDNTPIIADRAIRNLKYCTGRLFNIPNSGKGVALKYGLERTSGEIIFRIDSDSLIDENAISSIIYNFKDPTVGVVGGLIFNLEEKTIWQKTIQLLIVYFNYVIRRAQDLTDSIQVESGAYSVFRRDALMKIGGWADGQLGEDGEITNRLGRYGYRTVFDPSSLTYSDAPPKLVGVINQRARWNIAYYHARARNFNLFKEFRGPRSMVFITNLIGHGTALVHSLIWPFLAASIMVGAMKLSSLDSVFAIPLKIVLIQIVFFTVEIILFGYFLNKHGKLRYLIYFPMRWIISSILALGTRPQVMEILLAWSSKWKKYDKESFEDLRKMVRTDIDPVL
jgi:biofilm PGA synthesis N-glycosyltransferase PgaC